MLEAVVEGAATDELEGVDVVTRAALAAGPADVLAADGYVLGTPANLGYMSGALKDFFDRAYYPCLPETGGRPFGLFVHGNSDTTGAETGVDKITTGLGWRRVRETVTVLGEPSRTDLEACWDLGATVAAHVASG